MAHSIFISCRHDLTGLTMEQKKEKWAAVPDDEKKVLSLVQSFRTHILFLIEPEIFFRLI